MFTAHTEYWIWLGNALGGSSGHADDVIRRYPDPTEFYQAVHEGLCPLSTLEKEDYEKLLSFSLDDSFKIMEYCEKQEILILTPDMPEFPHSLLNIYGCPPVLYMKGSFTDLNHTVNIGMVGSREPTGYGRKAGYVIANQIALAGGVVVSGLARGIDSACHQGALAAGCPTAAVLGCGINVVYPPENEGLYRRITECGALLSEFPPDTPAYRFNFPQRNRLISGLSHAIVVVEAGISSGALITANLALEQGKDIYAVPNSIFAPQGQGTFRLLADGAVPVANGQDLMKEYARRFPDKIRVDIRLIKEKLAKRAEALDKDAKESGKMPKMGMTFQKRTKPADIPPPPEPPAAAKEDAGLLTEEDIPEMMRSLLEDQPKTEEVPAAAVRDPNMPDWIEGEAAAVYQALSDSDKRVDELVELTELSASRVLSVLTVLEIGGEVISYPGRLFGLTKNSGK